MGQLISKQPKAPGRIALATVLQGHPAPLHAGRSKWHSDGDTATISTFAISELLTMNNIKLFGTTIKENINNSMWNYGAALSLIMLFLIGASTPSSQVMAVNRKRYQMMQSLFSKDMMKRKYSLKGYLWLLLLLLYSPIFIIIIFSFTEAKVMGNWTGFSLQLYKNLFAEGTHHSLTAALVNTVTIALITATVSTLFGTLTAIGIYNLRNRYARNAIQFVNNIPILNGDIIIGISLFLLFITLGIPGAILP